MIIRERINITGRGTIFTASMLDNSLTEKTINKIIGTHIHVDGETYLVTGVEAALTRTEPPRMMDMFGARVKFISKIHEVNSCRDCPLKFMSGWEDEEFSCGASDEMRTVYSRSKQQNWLAEPPHWCPIGNGSYTIKLKRND